ncbi:MAG: signal peptide peptidase SppA [Candidatus Woesearchaeota archaeon]|nr:signal peptide peptidase SppA [Candidatus Woesearchaeota archaeon]
MPSPKPHPENKLWHATKIIASLASFILTLLVLLLVGSIAINFFSSSFSQEIQSGNIAIIPLKGIIMTGQDFSESIDSEEIIEFIEEANEDSSIKAIIFDINSPGGTPVASEEIASAIKKANKTTVAVIRDVGASGAYWVASATNEIWANKMSVTGSIGVIGSYLEFAKFTQDWNLTYRRLVGGKNKDIGDPFSELTPEKEALLQNEIDLMHTYFIEAVAENRNLSIEQVRELADGRTYLGSTAKELGLIDNIGNMNNALEALEQQFNITAETVVYEHRADVFDILNRFSAQSMQALGKGIGTGLLSKQRLLT